MHLKGPKILFCYVAVKLIVHKCILIKKAISDSVNVTQIATKHVKNILETFFTKSL